MSDFVKKVQVDGETKPISLGEEVLGRGLTLDEGKVQLFIDEYSGNWLDLSAQGLLLDSAAIKEEIKKTPVSLDPYGMLEKKSHGLALRLHGMGYIKTGLDMVWDGHSVPCVQLDPYGGLEIGDNGIKISDSANAGGGSVTLDPYGGLVEADEGLRLCVDTNGTKATGIEIKYIDGYYMPSVKLKPDGGLVLSTEGLTLDTAKLMEEIKNHFNLQ